MAVFPSQNCLIPSATLSLWPESKGRSGAAYSKELSPSSGSGSILSPFEAIRYDLHPRSLSWLRGKMDLVASPFSGKFMLPVFPLSVMSPFLLFLKLFPYPLVFDILLAEDFLLGKQAGCPGLAVKDGSFSRLLLRGLLWGPGGLEGRELWAGGGLWRETLLVSAVWIDS